MNTAFPEHLGLDLIVNEASQVKCKCRRCTASSNHNCGRSVHHEVKFPVYFSEHFKSTEGVEGKFPVIITAFEIVSLVSFCVF